LPQTSEHFLFSNLTAHYSPTEEVLLEITQPCFMWSAWTGKISCWRCTQHLSAHTPGPVARRFTESVRFQAGNYQVVFIRLRSECLEKFSAIAESHLPDFCQVFSVDTAEKSAVQNVAGHNYQT